MHALNLKKLSERLVKHLISTISSKRETKAHISEYNSTIHTPPQVKSMDTFIYSFSQEICKLVIWLLITHDNLSWSNSFQNNMSLSQHTLWKIPNPINPNEVN